MNLPNMANPCQILGEVLCGAVWAYIEATSLNLHEITLHCLEKSAQLTATLELWFSAATTVAGHCGFHWKFQC